MYLTVTSNSYSNKSILMYHVGVYLGFLVSNKLIKKIVRNRAGIELKIVKTHQTKHIRSMSVCGMIELKIDIDVNDK
jgi:penicillin-binding protein-related factor A (putative recombinase)